MKYRFLKYIFIVILFLPSTLFAQNQTVIDSLLKIVHNPKTQDTTFIKTYNDLGIQYATVDFNLAKLYINKALATATKIQNKRGMAGSKNCLGIVYYYNKDYDTALFCFKEALALNKEVGHYWGQASALFQMGVIYKFQSKNNEALQCFKNSKNLFETLKDSVSMAKSLENIGATYYWMGLQEKGTQSYLQAIKIYEKKGAILDIGRGYSLISLMLIEQEEDYQKALEYIDKALVIIKKEKNKQLISSLLMQKSISYYRLNKFETALVYAQQSLSYRKISGNERKIASLQQLIGEIYYGLKKYSKSLQYLNNALHNYTPHGDYKSKTKAYNALARTYLKIHSLDSAKLYARKAMDLSKNTKNLREEKESYIVFTAIAEEENKLKEAFNYYKRTVLLTDSIHHKQKQKQARDLQAFYEAEQKEKQIELQNNKIKLLNQEASINKLHQILLLSGLAIILTTFTLLYLKNKKKIQNSKLEVEQQHHDKVKLDKKIILKTNELASLVLHLSQKKQVFQQIKQTIQDFPEKDQTANHRYLIKIINQELKRDDYLNQIKQYFEQLHEGFYAKVKQTYPNLTSNDLRLISLLRMNLSAKEISNILNITLEGTKKARLRLRTKMKLNPEDSLEDILIDL